MALEKTAGILELEAKVKALLLEFEDKGINILVFAHEDNNTGALMMGLGCAACNATDIMGLLVTGQLKHNADDVNLMREKAQNANLN